MADQEPPDVTVFLRRMQSGDRAALDLLTDLVYPQLRRMAHAYFQSEKRERILQPTALVNEAYLRLVRHRDHNWRNRAHFFAAAAQPDAPHIDRTCPRPPGRKAERRASSAGRGARVGRGAFSRALNDR